MDDHQQARQNCGDDLADKVARLCLDKYAALRKSGKPGPGEWTVLSGIVVQRDRGEEEEEEEEESSLRVAALCTGTKCLSGAELLGHSTRQHSAWPAGSRLADSHAEILARRAFLRYLYQQLREAFEAEGASDIFSRLSNDEAAAAGPTAYSSRRCLVTLMPGVHFHFFSSQVPCGDCSIMPKHDDDVVGDVVGDDVYRTGAKCLASEAKQDPKGVGSDYHVVGPLRTKPGRGEPTLSLSCSDKMAKWLVMGVQGALLSLLIAEPIKFKSIVIGAGSPFSLESMRRGLYGRFNSTAITAIPDILGANDVLRFCHRKSATRARPCASSVIWCDVPDSKSELQVGVEGRKQGAAISNKMNKSSYLLVSKRALLETFLQIVDQHAGGGGGRTPRPISQWGGIPIGKHPKKVTYVCLKRASRDYQQLWAKCVRDIFPAWPVKPSSCLEDFVLL